MIYMIISPCVCISWRKEIDYCIIQMNNNFSKAAILGFSPYFFFFFFIDKFMLYNQIDGYEKWMNPMNFNISRSKVKLTVIDLYTCIIAKWPWIFCGKGHLKLTISQLFCCNSMLVTCVFKTWQNAMALVDLVSNVLKTFKM